ncbi:hypothetical protein Ancab_025592 [Ancistrocladus abbreviatus]
MSIDDHSDLLKIEGENGLSFVENVSVGKSYTVEFNGQFGEITCLEFRVSPVGFLVAAAIVRSVTLGRRLYGMKHRVPGIQLIACLVR